MRVQWFNRFSTAASGEEHITHLSSSLQGNQLYQSRSIVNQGAKRPRLPTFSGTHWKVFKVCFEEAAKRSTWDEADKLDQFFRCLKGAGTDYYAYLPTSTRRDYKKLINAFSFHFDP